MNRNYPYGATYPGAPMTHHAPNAALLIDFDNVTVGVRSDLGKELKALLNSDIIKGKVAVQRAYADWRRYPQYIVPLTEASVDLIFAPAYGTSKKNATDLRMAVDAIELVFTRPEIGTFILLTGDSDFSSCVLKLKEYGKYVIGVGMRESSSDLLIQNCDEYYSYHSLSGLTRASVGGAQMTEDPWQLVREAVRQMQASRDAMRPDRLKQVMVSLDPAFDEKKIGYSKFSRFVQEAATKGIIRLKRVGDGQYEIVADEDGAERPAREAAEPRAEERPRERDRDRDRGRGRGRDRDRRPRPEPVAHTADEELIEAPATDHEEPEVVGVLERVKGPETEAAAPVVGGMQEAYGLLQHAVRSLAGRGGTVRDGEVKRRMLELVPDFDETKLGFSKFSRFLRQAHDAEAIDLRRLGENSYEVALPASGKRLPVPSVWETAGAAAPAAEAPTMDRPQPEAPAAEPQGRGRGRGRGRPEGPPPLLPGQVVGEPAAPAAEPAEAEAPAAAAPVAAPTRPEPEVPAPVSAPLAVEAAAAGTPAGRVSLRGRRGSRGRADLAAPPPLLPGQVIPAATPRPEASAAEEAPAAAAPAAEAPAVEPQVEEARTTESPEIPFPPVAAVEDAAEAAPAPPARKRGRGRGRKGAAAEPTPEAAAPPAFSAEALGLPTDETAISDYLTHSYKGVGKKTTEMLVQAVGGDLFRVLEEEPGRVREVLGDRRANALLEQWAADRDRRREESPARAPLPVPVDETPEAVAEEAAPAAGEPGAAAEGDPQEEAPRGRGRGRRGGRGRGRKGGDAEATGEAPAAPAAAAVEEAPAPATEAETAAPRKSRSRGRRGGKGRDAEAAAPEAAPPAAESGAPAEGGEPDGGPAGRPRSRGRRGGRGRGRRNGGAAE
jgi:uncharacterized protein (TIGR00288 family)